MPKVKFFSKSAKNRLKMGKNDENEELPSDMIDFCQFSSQSIPRPRKPPFTKFQTSTSMYVARIEILKILLHHTRRPMSSFNKPLVPRG